VCVVFEVVAVLAFKEIVANRHYKLVRSRKVASKMSPLIAAVYETLSDRIGLASS